MPEYLNAGARHFGFMLRGLKELALRAAALNIPFFLFRGDPTATVPAFVRSAGAALLVTDFAALRLGRQWRKEVRNCDAPSSLQAAALIITFKNPRSQY